MDKQEISFSQWAGLEERANAVTHGFGLLLSVLGLTWLLFIAQATADSLKIGVALTFGTSLVLVYAASTLYHSFQAAHLKRFLQIVDHCAIYVLIAGSYTPFTLITLGDLSGWYLFLAVWAMALGGIVFKIMFSTRWNMLSLLFYLVMGWSILVVVDPLVEQLPRPGLDLLVAGGCSYTLGAVVYLLERPLFHHAIWHLFVLGGSACHYFAVLFYVL